ncbi:hypothetical protein LHYA1_G001952 [Lachnellula hyalina]|uniref:Uncharacterized protein n=1 Tax=Lachnellula hyalina TaxID=1316788 RepID=A0A8H8R565_9HELO|nr:uncharacterized protein LHYA1_G001952 [Lachnellula hyalina]TVY28553.1 hypothetical protein LHYA1_G001952 [Lachnellula hyalina]
MSQEKIDPASFYFQYQGHPISDISTFHSITLSQRPNKPIVYLAGDSSLDNKHWISPPFLEPLPEGIRVPSIYHSTFSQPWPKPDIAFWLNHFFGSDATALNCAVEASTLKDRGEGKGLLEHDVFVRDHISANDILIVSIGANDIALKPTFATICHMLRLAWLTPRLLLNSWTLTHFTDLFKTQVQAYVEKLVEKQKPRAVVVCMIYYPLVSLGANQQRSWADLPLKLLGYNLWPRQLQTAIGRMYELGTKRVVVEGVRVVPCALYEVLDGKEAGDYEERVEPSVEGGRKMAALLKGIVDEFVSEEDDVGYRDDI